MGAIRPCHPPSASVRRFFSIFAVLGLLAWPSVGTASAVTVDGPVLWEGEVRRPDGRPVGAEVVAYVRPPAGSERGGADLVPIAATTAGSSGRFTLRALPGDAVRAATDPGGWVTVMVAALSRDGVALAVDSVAWQPATIAAESAATQAAATRGGRWVTSPGERLVGSSPASSKGPRAAADHGEASVPPTRERPRVLVVGGRRLPRTVVPAGRPPETRGCYRSGSKDAGTHMVAVGELHLNSYWGGLFDYANTKTTSFQVGVSEDGKQWKAGGSVTIAGRRKASQEQAIPSTPTNRFWTYRAQMVFERISWVCGWEYHYWFVETLEPVEWTGGLRQDKGGRSPGCNRKYLIDVVPGGKFAREKGSSLTLDAAIRVPGFTGSMTSAVSEDVRYLWHNNRPRHRNLCGTSSFPADDTRIRSFA